MIDQCRDLRIRIDADKAAAELIALEDVDQPGIVFGISMSGRQQLLQQDRDLLAVGCSLRVQLQRMLSDWQLLLEGRAGHRSVRTAKRTAIDGLLGPDLGRYIAW